MDRIENAKYLRDIDSITEKIKRNPSNDDLFFNRAFLYKAIGEYKLAIEDYKSILLLNDKDVDCYLNIAELEYTLGNYVETINNCDKALLIYEDDAYYTLKMLSYKQLGQFDNAIIYCKKAIEKSDCAENRFNLALLYYETNDIENARKEIVEVQQMLYGDEDICESVENLKSKIESYKYNDICDDDKIFEKIFLLFENEKYKDVVFELSKKLEDIYNSQKSLDNNNANERSKQLIAELNETLLSLKSLCLTILGFANIKLGNMEFAAMNFSDAIEINKTNAIAFFYRAKVFFNLGEYSKAIYDCSNVEYCINISNYAEDEDINLRSINDLRNTILSKQNNIGDSRIEINDSNEEIIRCLNKLFYSNKE